MSGPGGSDRRLRRRERLRGAQEFRRLFRDGARIEGATMVLLWRRAGEGREVGFVAGRRLGGAVVRNRLRRRLREAYRLGKVGETRRGFQLCFIARTRVGEVEIGRLGAEMGVLLREMERRATA